MTLGWASVLSVSTSTLAVDRGVIATFTSLASGATDVRHDRLVALAVPAGTVPASMLPGGPFRVVCETSLAMPLRGEVTFSFAGNGHATLLVNNESALDEAGAVLGAKTSTPIKLNKGANSLRVMYESPPTGDAVFRLYWSGKDFGREPVPPEVLSCDSSLPALRAAEQLRAGRALFAELRCAKCHGESPGAAMPEFSDQPPSLEDAGARFREGWLAAWIADPKKLRADAAMPRVHLASPQDAADIAAWLATQGKPAAIPNFNERLAARGAQLFVELRCIACHALPGRAVAAGGVARVSLEFAQAKWQPAALISFLKNPTDYDASTRMPNCALAPDEAQALAAFLLSRVGGTLAESAGDATRGKVRFETAGCLKCHAPIAGVAVHAVAAKPLATLDWTRGCMADTPARRGDAPDFSLDVAAHDALRAMADAKFSPLAHDAPVEFAQRQFISLRCAACHARDGHDAAFASLTDETAAVKSELPAAEASDAPAEEGLDQEPPKLADVGAKLKTEWIGHFIAGEISRRPRPWLKARMPAFGSRADGLALGLSLEHGQLPAAEPDLPFDAGKARTGARLTAADAFNCVQCHAVGAQAATAPFGAPGVNFSHVHERVRREWFERWLDNPPRVSPGTKMPKFTDSAGRSAQTAVLGGDAHAQWGAIYEYLRRLHDDGAVK